MADGLETRSSNSPLAVHSAPTVSEARLDQRDASDDRQARRRQEVRRRAQGRLGAERELALAGQRRERADRQPREVVGISGEHGGRQHRLDGAAHGLRAAGDVEGMEVGVAKRRPGLEAETDVARRPRESRLEQCLERQRGVGRAIRHGDRRLQVRPGEDGAARGMHADRHTRAGADRQLAVLADRHFLVERQAELASAVAVRQRTPRRRGSVAIRPSARRRLDVFAEALPGQIRGEEFGPLFVPDRDGRHEVAIPGVAEVDLGGPVSDDSARGRAIM